MKIKFAFALFFFAFTPIISWAQSNVIFTKYYFPELADTAATNKLKEKVAMQYKLYLKPPLKIADCVYFNDAVQHCFDKAGNFNLFSAHSSFFPPSLWFNTDPAKSKTDSLSSLLLYPAVALENYTQPFYFRKYEVTNAEYWKFVRYVRDSVARAVLASNGFADKVFTDFDVNRNSWRDVQNDPYHQNTKEKIHWNTYDPDYRAALSLMFLNPGYEMYENDKNDSIWKNKKINTEMLDFRYYYDSSGQPMPIQRDGSLHYRYLVNVYPDTLSWVKDFNFPGSKKMSEVYFWHPVFADYPVVGITYDQAKAFLNWKTIEEQKKLDAKGIKLSVEYDLPNEMEWEIAATTVMVDGKLNSYGKNFPMLADTSWITDLMLDSSGNKKMNAVPDFSPLKFFNLLRSADGYIFTAPADLRKVKKESEYNLDGEKFSHDNSEIKKQLDDCGISFMGGNVSEWLKQDYPAWLSAFLLRLELLHISKSPDAQLTHDREAYFNTFNSKVVPAKKPMVAHFLKPKVNKLVRGANWFDERYSQFAGKNPTGTNAKTFLDPETAHCTIGFRYVIHVKVKK